MYMLCNAAAAEAAGSGGTIAVGTRLGDEAVQERSGRGAGRIHQRRQRFRPLLGIISQAGVSVHINLQHSGGYRSYKCPYGILCALHGCADSACPAGAGCAVLSSSL